MLQSLSYSYSSVATVNAMELIIDGFNGAAPWV